MIGTWCRQSRCDDEHFEAQVDRNEAHLSEISGRHEYLQHPRFTGPDLTRYGAVGRDNLLVVEDRIADLSVAGTQRVYMNTKDIAFAFATANGYDSVEPVDVKLNGADVFLADYEGRPRLSGLPPYVLVEDDTPRMATVHEIYGVLRALAEAENEEEEEDDDDLDLELDLDE